MPSYGFDLETNGLLDELDTIHSLVLEDLDTGEVHSFHGSDIETGLQLMSDADLLVGHNIIPFDIPAIQKVFPDWNTRAVIRDTLVCCRLIWSDLMDIDRAKAEKAEKSGTEYIPKQLRGRHSLEAWGYRLGEWKGDYGQERKALGKERGLTGQDLTDFVWGSWSQEMQDYCVQDGRVTVVLWQRCLRKLEEWGIDPYDPCPPAGKDCLQLEHDVAVVIARQERFGFAFDEKKGWELYATLVGRKAELEKELQKAFKPWFRNRGIHETTKTRLVKQPHLGTVELPRYGKNGNLLKPYIGPVKAEYSEGSSYTKTELVSFNPGSRDEIADRLIKLRGWKPKEFTPEGRPKVDEDVLSDLDYPEAKLLTEYFLVQKRIGQLAEGPQAWLKVVRDGRIYGTVNTIGAVTGRMTHARPNIAQVPSLANDKGPVPFGRECRELFTVPEGKVLVGCDADGLELRCLAGYMAKYDGGEYVRTVLEGKKEDKTDMHSRSAQILGITRDTAKRWFYAFLYGAGNVKLGLIQDVKGNKAAAGKKARTKFMDGLPALKNLVERVKEKSEIQGWILGLDGRRLKIRSSHAALNTLLQSAGAVFMKRALVILDDDLSSTNEPGKAYEFVANVHDEWQIEAAEDLSDYVGKSAAEAIKEAGEFYNFRCPLAGDYEFGKTWADTH